MAEPRIKRIVIIGGGAIGSSAAYFLTRHSHYDPRLHPITLLEATEIAGGASGKSGGCLASWATPTCLASLSFQIHSDLATEHEGSQHWGYRRVHTLDCEANNDNPDPAVHRPSEAPQWIVPGRLTSCVESGRPSDTAQLHPFLYTTFLADQAQSLGAKLILGSATVINYTQDRSAVKSVSYKPKGSELVEELNADYVILAAGPWTPNLLPRAPIGGARSHSIVLDVPSSKLSPHVLFFDKPDPGSWFPKLEIYPRPDDTAYVCGPTDYRAPLPASTDLVDVDRDSCQLIQRAAESLSDQLSHRHLLAEQACYRPVVRIPGRPRSAGPLLGKTKIGGLILAAGHDEWGIQNSAATGKIISELVLEGMAVSADISSLDPGDVC